MKVNRRAALLGLALTGCAPNPTGSTSPTRRGPQSARPVTPISSPTGVAPSPSGTTPSPTPTPTRDAIVAQFQGRTPKAFGLEVPGVITRLATTAPEGAIALTFDACGGDRRALGYDRDLIETLRAHNTPATLFINARWLAAHRSLVAELAADPLFELANHGTKHVPLTVTGRAAYGIAGTKNVAEAYDEIAGCQRELTPYVEPKFFRSGTAHVDDVGVDIAQALGRRVVNFSVNADAGATFSSAQVASALTTVKSGDIVIAHFNRPEGQTAEGFKRALPRLLERGLKPVRLFDGLPIS